MGRVEVLGEGASLQDLCALIDNPDVSEIDLAGRVVETQGCLHIRREGLRVKNGTLAITGGDVKVSSAKGDVSCWVAGVVVDAPNCVLEKVVLRGVQGISIVVNKAPGAVLKGCQIWASRGMAVLVTEAATDLLVDACIIRNPGAHGIKVDYGARVRIDKCDIEGCGTTGIAVARKGSFANISATKVSRCRERGIGVYDGATAEVQGTQVTDCLTPAGGGAVYAMGEGSSISLKACSIKNNAGRAVVASYGRCECSDVEATGNKWGVSDCQNGGEVSGLE